MYYDKIYHRKYINQRNIREIAIEQSKIKSNFSLEIVGNLFYQNLRQQHD